MTSLIYFTQFNDTQLDTEVSRTVSVTDCDGSSNDNNGTTTTSSSAEGTAVVTPANIPLEAQSQSQQANNKQEGSVVSSESTPTGSPLHEEHQDEVKVPAGGELADASVSEKKMEKHKKLESSAEASESDTKESESQRNIPQSGSVSEALSTPACPREGSWMGSFLNVSKKMDRTPLKPVDETFDMEFINSSQQNPALTVKGTGSNKFGKFELTGEFVFILMPVREPLIRFSLRISNTISSLLESLQRPIGNEGKHSNTHVQKGVRTRASEEERPWTPKTFETYRRSINIFNDDSNRNIVIQVTIAHNTTSTCFNWKR